MGYEGEWYKSYYYITNIDTSDTQREIAVIDMGPSDDAITCFTDIRIAGLLTMVM